MVAAREHTLPRGCEHGKRERKWLAAGSRRILERKGLRMGRNFIHLEAKGRQQQREQDSDTGEGSVALGGHRQVGQGIKQVEWLPRAMGVRRPSTPCGVGPHVMPP